MSIHHILMLPSSFSIAGAFHPGDEIEGSEYSGQLDKKHHKLKSLKIHLILENLQF